MQNRPYVQYMYVRMMYAYIHIHVHVQLYSLVIHVSLQHTSTCTSRTYVHTCAILGAEIKIKQ